MAQSTTKFHSARGCVHRFVSSTAKLAFSSSSRDSSSSREPMKALSFWARKAPLRKYSRYKLKPVSRKNSSTLVRSCASSSRLNGACICTLGSSKLEAAVERRVRPVWRLFSKGPNPSLDILIRQRWVLRQAVGFVG